MFHYQLPLHLRRPHSSTPWWHAELARFQHSKRMEEVASWAQTGVMVTVKEEVKEETVEMEVKEGVDSHLCCSS